MKSPRFSNSIQRVAPPLMSADDFLGRCKSYRRYRMFMAGLYSIAFAAASVMGWWLEREGGCGSDSCFLLVLLAAILIGAVMVYALIRGPKKRAQELGLNCPACGKL